MKTRNYSLDESVGEKLLGSGREKEYGVDWLPTKGAKPAAVFGPDVYPKFKAGQLDQPIAEAGAKLGEMIIEAQNINAQIDEIKAQVESLEEPIEKMKAELKAKKTEIGKATSPLQAKAEALRSSFVKNGIRAFNQLRDSLRNLEDGEAAFRQYQGILMGIKEAQEIETELTDKAKYDLVIQTIAQSHPDIMPELMAAIQREKDRLNEVMVLTKRAVTFQKFSETRMQIREGFGDKVSNFFSKIVNAIADVFGISNQIKDLAETQLDWAVNAVESSGLVLEDFEF